MQFLPVVWHGKKSWSCATHIPSRGYKSGFLLSRTATWLCCSKPCSIQHGAWQCRRTDNVTPCWRMLMPYREYRLCVSDVRWTGKHMLYPNAEFNVLFAADRSCGQKVFVCILCASHLCVYMNGCKIYEPFYTQNTQLPFSCVMIYDLRLFPCSLCQCCLLHCHSPAQLPVTFYNRSIFILSRLLFIMKGGFTKL